MGIYILSNKNSKKGLERFALEKIFDNLTIVSKYLRVSNPKRKWIFCFFVFKVPRTDKGKEFLPSYLLKERFPTIGDI